MKLLLIEDDDSFGYIMKAYLEMHDYQVHWVKEGKGVMKLIRERPFDLCILDIMLPETDGFSIARRIQEEYPGLPFIFLTAKSLKVDKLRGYKLGCDDYITKPVDEELLLAKIQAILKRAGRSGEEKANEDKYQIGSFTFDPLAHRLQRGEDARLLTEKEARLLRLLCEYDHQLLRREQALKEIWGKNDLFNRKTMDVFIFKLRQYLSADPSVRIRNVHGKGFVLEWERQAELK